MAKALNLVVDDDDSVYFSKYSDDGRMNIKSFRSVVFDQAATDPSMPDFHNCL